MSIDLNELADPHNKPDFRRAGGVPQVVVDGKRIRYSRPSSFGKVLDDENALVNWKLNRAIEGVAGDKALQARAVAAKPDDRKTWTELREACINAGRGDQGADIGTAIHAMSERIEDPDDNFQPSEPYKSFLDAYVTEMARLGLVSEKIEFQIASTKYRAAGTCDRLYRLTKPLQTPDGEMLPEGSLIIADLKTGRTLDYSKAGYAVQLAIYASGELYDVVNDEFLDTPDINQKWALLVHIPSDREPQNAVCEMLWVDLEVGHWGAYLVQQVKFWRRDWRNGSHDAWPATTEFDSTAFNNEDDWVTKMIDWIKLRLEGVRSNDEALTALTHQWPEGHPTPKNMTTAEHVTPILDLLDKIEADYGLPFPGDDPRSMPGTHKSEIVSSNEVPS